MKKFLFAALALAVAGATALPAQAQQQRGRGFGGAGASLLSLAEQKSVQDELKLSDDQVQKLKQVAEKQRESFRGLQDLSREERGKKFRELAEANSKAVAEALKPEQLKRLKQIALQQRGASALDEAEVAGALNLTDEQKEKIKAVRDESRKESRALFEGGNREEARQKLAALRKTTDEKLLAVLTDAQKAKWKELAGEPFKGEIRRRGPRPGTN